MYMIDLINPFEFISFLPDMNLGYPNLIYKLAADLSRFGCETNNVIEFVMQCKDMQRNTAIKYNTDRLLLRPAIIFG